jgi:hypothetical protein
MLVVLDIEIGGTEAEKTRAAHEICQCIEVAVSRARREVAAKKVPHLFKSGVKYVQQDPRACAMRPPSEVMKRGGGDCKQLVLWRIAELRESGVHATPRIIWLADKKGLRAHAQVRLPDGSTEDPSYNLGMKP